MWPIDYIANRDKFMLTFIVCYGSHPLLLAPHRYHRPCRVMSCRIIMNEQFSISSLNISGQKYLPRLTALLF